MSDLTPRQELLLHMYDQMLNDINQHIIVVWQSIGVAVGAFAILALVEKQIISLDLGAGIIVLICGWLLANLIDSSYRYNRNLAIISNIERQFLELSDLKEIHYYFGANRPNKMITHLRIQRFMGISLSVLILLFHFYERIAPGLFTSWNNIELSRSIPYLVSTVTLIWLYLLANHRKRSYQEFIINSPGKIIDTKGIEYGEGHGYKRR